MTISASKFKEQCLSLLDSVDPEGIVVTKHGRPVARLVPIASNSAHLIGCLEGKLQITGDVFTTGVEWLGTDGGADGNVES
jgi:prevent-host-death family protein